MKSTQILLKQFSIKEIKYRALLEQFLINTKYFHRLVGHGINITMHKFQEILLAIHMRVIGISHLLSMLAITTNIKFNSF